MTTTYHLCLSEEKEVLFRCEEDFIRGINCLCLAAYQTESSLLAYAFMSNHIHICIRTEDYNRFTRAFWYPYTRYFNAKYKRCGRLGSEGFYKQKVEGLRHFLTTIAYILRNPMHHGITSTPFGYKFSSVKSIFKNEFGWHENEQTLTHKYEYKFIPCHKRLPEAYKMNKDGMIVPECVIDINDLEHQFSTARTFLYYMNRLSGEKWEHEQMLDGVEQKPITLEDIEHGNNSHDVRTMLANEHGRSNYKGISDLQLCKEIDSTIVKNLKKKSIYELNESEKEWLRNTCLKKHIIPNKQLDRCLVIKTV